MTTIIHFTTVHPRTDTRIRVKEVATLARHWPEQVALYVQDGLGDEAAEGYQIVDTGPRPDGNCPFSRSRIAVMGIVAPPGGTNMTPFCLSERTSIYPYDFCQVSLLAGHYPCLGCFYYLVRRS